MKFLFFGALQGITEFLPISSSGHLYLLKRILMTGENLLSFFILLHLATLLAILVYFWKEIIKLLTNRKIIVHIAIITTITALIALVVKYSVSRYFDSKYLVCFCFIINGIILLTIKKTSQIRNRTEIKLKDSLILGLVQAFALFPGISRSGITISTLLRRGFKNSEAFSISFIMAIPIILIAFFSEPKILNLPTNQLITGFLAAFIAGIASLAILKRLILKWQFKKFGIYSIIIAIIGVLL